MYIYFFLFVCIFIFIFIFIVTGRNLEYSQMFQFFTQNLEYRHMCNLRISPPAKNYVFWLQFCFLAVVALFHQFSRFPTFGQNLVFSLLWHFFINFPDFQDSAQFCFLAIVVLFHPFSQVCLFFPCMKNSGIL